jgi:hypothetical protein
MLKNLLHARRKFGLLCVLLAFLSISTQVFAQLDYDTYDIYQNGVDVGVIYVPARGADPSVYSEYWIMSGHYVYPSETNQVATEIRHSDRYHFTSLADLLANAPWGEGFHYVTVTAFDRTTRPVPALTTVE